jgi:exodeoxyribonuclease VII large subunit
MFPTDEAITVSEFIGLLNQTLDYAYGVVAVVGELANFRISKNKWVYFDLKDDTGSLKFFGTVYQIRQPLEEGMLIKVLASPHMHNLYGFSMQIQTIELVGEGSLKRAAEILQQKLSKEGLFDEERKRPLTYPPSRIGLITSSQSAAYADFIKIINARWRGVEINLIDVQVQGEPAIKQITDAFDYFNKNNKGVDTLVLIRGGGSPEDLAAFSSEEVTRAVAASVIPTLVAIGHEIDVSLAELAADKRASTPSNAAELLVPDKTRAFAELKQATLYLDNIRKEAFKNSNIYLKSSRELIRNLAQDSINNGFKELKNSRLLLTAYNPNAILKRGYSIIRKANKALTSTDGLRLDDILDIKLAKGSLSATVSSINKDK